MTEEPSVDVILPNYNKSLFLEEAINSVISQDYNNWHLYIVDDNSYDNSLKILKKFSDHAKISIIKLKKNMGPSFCRNYAMRLSKSKYIAFIDSDDSWKNSKLKKQINFMEQNDYVFTYSDYTSFFDKNEKKKIIKRTYLKDSFNFGTFIRDSSINTTTMIISRSILGTHRFKKIGLLEDYLFKCELFKSNYLAKKINEDLAFYRILSNSRSSKRLKNIFWLWHVNKKYNKLKFVENILSIFFISINSIKKYGIK
tara:strand:- start:73 stop:837 length:765 start_codon:yes stop_codon:yes gene_type:complete